jgi:hypothetical protein
MAQDPEELAAVQELAMGQMHIGEGGIRDLDELSQARRHAPRHARDWQGQRLRGRKLMRAPRRQPVDPPRQGLAEEVPAHQLRQRLDLLGRLLKQEKIGLRRAHQPSDILDGRSRQPEQVPAQDPETARALLVVILQARLAPVMGRQDPLRPFLLAHGLWPFP